MKDIDKLIESFVKSHENNYLKLSPYIAIIKAAYYFGYVDGKQITTHAKKVRRSDGVVYDSLTEAARINSTNKRNISAAAKNKHRSVGYYWELV